MKEYITLSYNIFRKNQYTKIFTLVDLLKKSRIIIIEYGFLEFIIKLNLYINRCIINYTSRDSAQLENKGVDKLRNDYNSWRSKYFKSNIIEDSVMIGRIKTFNFLPKISIIMPIYKTKPFYLNEAIKSVRGQLYPNWELCIADDCSGDPELDKILEFHSGLDSRIKYTRRDENGHISKASNSAIEISTGEYLTFLDHDDLLTPDALFWVVKYINKFPSAALLYSDEDKVDDSGNFFDPYFKSDYNYELLLAQNMICHLATYKKSLVKSIGCLRVGFEGSQDYDLVLRYIEKIERNEIIHIPRVLYHWRAIRGSTAFSPDEKNYASDAGRRAVVEHLGRLGISAEVMPSPHLPFLNRVRFLNASDPKVSIIIPTKDHVDLLAKCVDSILTKIDYKNYDILIVDNNSVEQHSQNYFNKIK